MNRLRTTRLAQGMSQLRLATLAGCSLNMIYLLEHGHRRPRVDLAQRIARALGTTVEDLFPLNEGTSTGEGGECSENGAAAG